ncbi:hypothetical protein Slin15195_G030100 [Septoria linicola]|uniref:Autophagy-related protein 16 domain-containing protein n=1 Tax=Septoria linicola TaxID=215465 RepID=A0A9Q9AS11_9PEZI|nr:hypothetical protein Slin14017_G029120 [Septoria linicola]USW49691.1 hypothetical protein Slin15195_G030100 [Septoria linicola]
MSGDWLEQYSAALDARDAREQIHKPYIDAYTKLADRTAAAAQARASGPAGSTPASPALPDRTATPTKGRASTKSPLPEAQATDLLSTLRADLANTQRVRASLQAQVTELTTSLTQLQSTQKDSTVQIGLLTKQKLDVERKLRDREEEIRGKARLVEEAQDEMVSLQLQLSMAEQKSEKLDKENKELVERWMRRMGEEVERVNRDAGWQ